MPCAFQPGTHSNKTAQLTRQVEKRMGPDGQMHPLVDFITFYGQQQGGENVRAGKQTLSLRFLHKLHLQPSADTSLRVCRTLALESIRPRKELELLLGTDTTHRDINCTHACMHALNIHIHKSICARAHTFVRIPSPRTHTLRRTCPRPPKTSCTTCSRYAHPGMRICTPFTPG